MLKICPHGALQLPKTRSTLQPTSEVLPNTSSTIQLNEKGLARQEESGDQHAGKSTEKQTIQTKPTMSSCEKKSSKQDPKLVKTQIEGTLYEKVVGCSTYEALQHSVIQMEIPPLPHLLDYMVMVIASLDVQAYLCMVVRNTI
ncbi:hypothetical protein MAR_020858 [Mya arenaria]|uniref:Uncharacterized protein n=1 Tax=Mya arenaria TaxID=6604 RepID=A0ABY7E8G6_MYAAR|nr:hypothetical protein MAR_020858 [Mya arenaria]